MSDALDAIFGATANLSDNAPAPAASSAQASSPEKVKSKLWLDTVLSLTINGETYETALPSGTALDTMKLADEASSNPEFARGQRLKNIALKGLLAKMESLAPGESVEITAKTVVRRVKDKADLSGLDMGDIQINL